MRTERQRGAKSFIPLGKGEGAALVFLLLFAAVSFLPIWRTREVAGMAVFGWLMAALMLLSPALMLWVFRRR